ncbi:response regulator transcription factor [Ramlibacter sp. H39-3-26]|uniref:response regulator transcription factor n=1 Tax=Curvibacter soli TaxID=3031331 RepID=UPI0023DA04B8|nr:response regulator transcription factor [Ramlibacter sp. H39-3-26]MDF1483878.1 response regulator transcription factor [Ramlibacter sp. H39-3-26]
MRIAALDDDAQQLKLVCSVLQCMGHDCVAFERAEPLLAQLRRESFDLLILDWQLPGASGLDVVRWARANLEHRVPIIFVTNRSDERDIVEGLSAGADDFMVKPLRVQELRARVQALLRRSYPEMQNTVLQYGGYRFDTVRRTVEFQGQAMELKDKEFDLARRLFANCGRLLSRAHLMQAVWGLDASIPSRTLDTHVSSLRAKLGLRPERGFQLTAVYGQGYRLEALDEGDAEGKMPA